MGHQGVRSSAASHCIGRERKIEQNKEIQMDRWLVAYVCVRDLLGPHEEENMLGGRRFKARQPSELVFFKRTSELVTYISK